MGTDLLGNRYEIMEKIGGGGMAVVYKAKCLLLNRYVAVKVLRPEFLNDDEVVKRFRVEAQSAASLSHPNIVPIYDVGNEDDVHYIVMEYIDGITLKEYIRSKGTIDWEEAVKIAIQVCSAMEHAHRNKIVHRDIKPQNILLANDGMVKVVDFGIARAATASTITMAGNTIGSVHYFSPEQARGGYTDEKSDLYSLGIVLFEMVTGTVPFEADTPVAVALMHLQSNPKVPSEINGDIPFALNDLIMKAIRKDKESRYQSAGDMLNDLYRILVEPDGRYVRVAREDEDVPTRKMQAVQAVQAVHNEMALREEDMDHQENEDEKENRRSRLSVWIAVATSLIIIGIFAFLGYRFVIPSITQNDNVFIVGQYVGKDITLVKDELSSVKINVKEENVYDDTVDKGIIMTQSVTPGQELKLDGFNTIEFTVSKGRELVKIPDERMREARLAEIDLKDKNLEVVVVGEYSDTVPKDLVIRTDPAAEEEVEPGSSITIFKSLGLEVKQVTVPDLKGKTLKQAQTILLNAKLTMGKIYPSDTSSEIATIKSQSPLPNTMADENSPVDMYLEDFGIGGNLIDQTIRLKDDNTFGDTIKIFVEAIPSNTGKPKVVLDRPSEPKSSFPYTFWVPVPDGGSTKVRIFLDNKLYLEYFLGG